MNSEEPFVPVSFHPAIRFGYNFSDNPPGRYIFQLNLDDFDSCDRLVLKDRVVDEMSEALKSTPDLKSPRIVYIPNITDFIAPGQSVGDVVRHFQKWLTDKLFDKNRDYFSGRLGYDLNNVRAEQKDLVHQHDPEYPLPPLYPPGTRGLHQDEKGIFLFSLAYTPRQNFTGGNGIFMDINQYFRDENILDGDPRNRTSWRDPLFINGDRDSNEKRYVLTLPEPKSPDSDYPIVVINNLPADGIAHTAERIQVSDRSKPAVRTLIKYSLIDPGKRS